MDGPFVLIEGGGAADALVFERPVAYITAHESVRGRHGF